MKKNIVSLCAALVSGGLCIAAFPGSPFPWLAFVCMAPWLATARYGSSLLGSVCGFAVGCLYSMPCTWGGIYTATKALNPDPAGAAALAFLFYIPYIVPFIITGLYLAVTGEQSGIRRAVGGSTLFTAAICAMPGLFPVTPGLMLHACPWAIQLADVGGVPMVNFFLFLINFLIAGIALALWKGRRPLPEAFLLFIVVALAAGYGGFRISAFKPDPSGIAARTVRVALIQPNLPRGVNEAGLIRDNRTQVVSALEMTRRLLKTEPFDLAVWPETSVNAACDQTSLVFRKLPAKAGEIGISFLYQCLDCRKSGCFNGARMVLPDGTAHGPYYKRALIPFVETKPPAWFPRFLSGKEPYRIHFRTGTEKIIFQTPQGVRVTPMICYDIHFPELLREDGTGDLIAVLANNQYFGKSRIGYLDYAMNIFRAVETRRPLVRVTNTGPSAMIQATGETVPGTLTSSGRPEARAATLHIPSGKTLYARFGDTFLYLLCGYLLGDMISIMMDRRHAGKRKKITGA